MSMGRMMAGKPETGKKNGAPSPCSSQDHERIIAEEAKGGWKTRLAA